MMKHRRHTPHRTYLLLLLSTQGRWRLYPDYYLSPKDADAAAVAALQIRGVLAVRRVQLNKTFAEAKPARRKRR